MKTALASKKEYATLQAQLALRGYSLSCTHDAPGGCTTYTVARWNLSRTFGDIGNVRAFLIGILGAST